MIYQIKLLGNVNESEIMSVLNEAEYHGEFVHPLWRLIEIGVDEWKKDWYEDTDNAETLLAFYVADRLVGVARVTGMPHHQANGKVGFYIRPSERKKKYAPSMIRMLEDWCAVHGIEDITAVVDVRNTASMKALYSAGWQRSGKEFRWNGNRNAVELKPVKNGS